MNKKIIAVAILMLVLVVLFAACKKDDYELSYTVPVEGGDPIEVYKDDEGNEFVTNVDGDKIPVTTDEDGFYDDITTLITQTTTTKSSNEENKTTTTTKPSEDKTTTTTTTTTTTSNNEDKTTTTNAPSVEVGSDSNKGASIDWDDIVQVP